MACYSPLHAFKGPVNENGKRPVIWRAPAGSEKQDIPCGKCVGCRLRYAKDWAIRCMHEASLYKENCFITLTFNEKCLPEDGSLSVRYVQLFMKRLRKRYPERKIKYFFAGEYGAKVGRPHYHGLLFNHSFPDQRFVVERFGNRVYESPTLKDLWPFGFHSIGDITHASASYVARYCVKKVSGEEADEHYADKRTGVLRKPEFTVMSRGGRTGKGIAYDWFRKYKDDVFPSDEVIFNGKSVKPPRYYDNLLDKVEPDLIEDLKRLRAEKVLWSESTLDRLIVKEEVRKAALGKYVRPLSGV